MRVVLGVLGVACVVGTVVVGVAAKEGSHATEPQSQSQSVAVKRVGVYDSRSVAVAYAGSKKQNESSKKDREVYDKAKAAGDQAKMDECRSRGREMQREMHAMAFSTAPVTGILDQYPDEIKALKARHHLDALVSIWDEKTLGKYPGAEKIDVTEELIEIPGPSERQRKNALAVRDSKPVTEVQLKQLEKDPNF